MGLGVVGRLCRNRKRRTSNIQRPTSNIERLMETTKTITEQLPVPMLRGQPVTKFRCGCGQKATRVKSKEPVCDGCGGIEKSGVKEKKRAGVRQRLYSLGEGALCAVV